MGENPKTKWFLEAKSELRGPKGRPRLMYGERLGRARGSMVVDMRRTRVLFFLADGTKEVTKEEKKFSSIDSL